MQREPAYIGAMGSFPDSLPWLLLVRGGNGWKWELLKCRSAFVNPDVAIDSKLAPTMISLLCRTKIDQARKGVKIVLGKTGRDLCLVKDPFEVRNLNLGPLLR